MCLRTSVAIRYVPRLGVHWNVHMRSTALHRLTKRQVETASPGRHGDGGGLWLQVTDSGSRSWLFRYQRDGRPHWMGLGSADTIGLADAREGARLARLALLEGFDPLEARRAQRAEQRRRAAATIVFRDAAKAVIEAREGGWNAEHARQWRASIEEVDHILGALPVAAIDTALVLKAIEPIWRRAQTTGDRTRQRIEAVLDWATARGARAGDNPARWSGHLEYLLKDSHRVKHHPALPYTDVAAFMRELRARSGTAARALEFLALCASRSGEVLGAKWSEVDLDQETWTVPPERLKTGKKQPDKPHVVPLSPDALKILADLPRDGEFVFSAPRGGGMMERHALADVMKAMARSETVHGLRSTFDDWAADCTGYPAEVREQALAHAIPNKVEAAYRRGALLAKRRCLMVDWAAFCTGQSIVDNVTPIRSVGADA
jgi:integrase